MKTNHKTHYNRAKAGSAETTALCGTLAPPGLFFTRDKTRVNCILCLRRLEAQKKRRSQ